MRRVPTMKLRLEAFITTRRTQLLLTDYLPKTLLFIIRMSCRSSVLHIGHCHQKYLQEKFVSS